MKSATLTRKYSSGSGTFGVLATDDGALTLSTVELPWRDNAAQRSCIPPAPGGDGLTYTCVWHRSPTKGWVYLLTGTAPREDILIHIANFGGDTQLGWQSDLEGCIGVGERQTRLQNKFGRLQMAAANSARAVRALAEWGAREDFLLRISWAPAAPSQEPQA